MVRVRLEGFASFEIVYDTVKTMLRVPSAMEMQLARSPIADELLTVTR